MSSSSTSLTVLITSATGTQGTALVSALTSLSLPISIRALVRDPSSPKSLALLGLSNAHTSIILTQGDFSSPASLSRALVPDEDGRVVDAVFLNTNPTFGDPEEEVRHARSVLEAAREKGVRHVVYTSVVGVADAEVRERIGGMPGWVNAEAMSLLGAADGPGIEAVKRRSKLLTVGENKVEGGITRELLRGYFGAKMGIEGLVKTWGGTGTGEGEKKTWTILRPAWFMTNFLPPANASYWPELSPSNPVLRSAISPNMRMMLVDPQDIGAVAARALLSPFVQDLTPSLVKKTINIGSQALTLTEATRIFSKSAGVQVKVEFVDEAEAAREIREGNIQRDAQAWFKTLQECFEPGELFEIIKREPKTFGEFLEGRKEELQRFFEQ
ncbi:uncharacterized protein N0V89_006853 [Didymosphaeria variabile]|uniref:NmrA-like domain-containing protein n=1 Tax=Didymosphaeria variabile TaxID=1932322 RepID=A0A9W8XHT9_9PLEO|nr:uncharacterized protein N0V89_006853 [Didymosphaeria variabile]KAJ4351510.1 hypothetical protein N0V89_006853 [Didymosphaeria variabile]